MDCSILRIDTPQCDLQLSLILFTLAAWREISSLLIPGALCGRRNPGKLRV